MLQFSLTELFDRNDDGELTLAAYTELGGLRGALARRAEQLYGEGDDEERRAVRHLFLELIALGEGTEDTRRRVRRSLFTEVAGAETVIDRYVAARLLTTDRDDVTREPSVEVAHEALIREWGRLREWLAEDREDLRTWRALAATARTWSETGCDAGDLARGARLDAAAELETSHPAVFGAITAEPRLSAIFPDPTGESSTVRFSGDGRVGVTAGLTSGVLSWQDLGTGEFDPSVDLGVGIAGLSIDADGSTVAVILADATVAVVERGGTVRSVDVPISPGLVELSPDGERLALTDADVVHLIDLTGPDSRAEYVLDADDATNWLGFSPNGALLAVAVTPKRQADVTDTADAVLLLDGESLQVEAEVPTPRGIATDLAVSDDGAFIAGFNDGMVERRVAGAPATEPLEQLVGAIVDVSRSGSGPIAVSSEEGQVTFMDVDGLLVAPPVQVGAEVADVAVREDGATIAMTSTGTFEVDFLDASTVMARHRIEAFSQIVPTAPYYDEPTPELDGLRIRSLAEGSLIDTIDLGAEFADGIQRPFYGTDGRWVVVPEAAGDLVALVEIGGRDRFVVDMDHIEKLAFGTAVDPGARMLLSARPGTEEGSLLFLVEDGEADHAALVVDAATGELLAGPLTTGGVGALLVFEDGRVAYGIDWAVPEILPAGLEGEIQRLDELRGLTPLAHLAGDDLLVLGGPAAEAVVVDLDDGGIVTLPGSTFAIGAAFSPDGRRLALFNIDGDLEIFDPRSGERYNGRADLGSMILAGGPNIRWNAEGDGVWVSLNEGPAELAASPERWVEIACGIVHRELTPEEWAAFVDDESEPVSACDELLG